MLLIEFNTASLSFLTFSLSTLSLLLYFILLHSLSPPPTKTPCPQSYPLIGNLIGFLRNRHRFHDWVADMLSTSTTTTLQVNGFLGLSHGICTANPSNIDHLRRSNFSNYVKGSRFHSVLHEFLGDGVFAVDGDLWFTQRKIASHEFNTKSLKNFISNTVRSQISDRLIPYLTAASENLESIDLQDIFQKFAFDNICNVAFGVDPKSLVAKIADNSLQNPYQNRKGNQTLEGTCPTREVPREVGPDACLMGEGRTSPVIPAIQRQERFGSRNSSFVHAFDCAVSVSSERFMSPLAAIWKFKRFFNIGSEKKLKEAIEVINDYALNIIKSKEKEYQTREEKDLDLLSRFMNSTSNLGFRDQHEKRKFLRDIVISFILAGKDSTSTALTWFFWLLAGHPRCERLIYDELSSSAAIVSPPASFSITYMRLYQSPCGCSHQYRSIQD